MILILLFEDFIFGVQAREDVNCERCKNWFEIYLRSVYLNSYGKIK